MENTTTNQPSTPDTPESPFFVGATALARYLGVDPVTVRRMQRRRALPYIKFGGKFLFRKAEIESYLSRHTIPAATSRKPRAAVAP